MYWMESRKTKEIMFWGIPAQVNGWSYFNNRHFWMQQKYLQDKQEAIFLVNIQPPLLLFQGPQAIFWSTIGAFSSTAPHSPQKAMSPAGAWGRRGLLLWSSTSALHYRSRAPGNRVLFGHSKSISPNLSAWPIQKGEVLNLQRWGCRWPLEDHKIPGGPEWVVSCPPHPPSSPNTHLFIMKI